MAIVEGKVLEGAVAGSQREASNDDDEASAINRKVTPREGRYCQIIRRQAVESCKVCRITKEGLGKAECPLCRKILRVTKLALFGPS